MKPNQELKQMDQAFIQMQEAYKKLRSSFLAQNYKAKSKFCIGVSAGHGGKDIYSKKYVTAPNKMFFHNGEEFHNQGFFYEGVFNRIIANKFCSLLKQNNIVYKKFYHENDDWGLRERTRMINNHHVNVQPVLLFDLHSNASKKHNARGFSVYTSPSQTESDRLATALWDNMNKISKKFGFSMRKETFNDKDVDYEAKFWMCVKTACPSILPECLFFDNIHDCRILMMDSFQNAYAEALFLTALWGDKNIDA